MNPVVWPQKQPVFIAKSTKTYFLLMNSRVITSILASICTPVAPSLLISSGHKPRLGGTDIVWRGAQPVIWGERPRNAPPPPPPWRRAWQTLCSQKCLLM